MPAHDAHVNCSDLPITLVMSTPVGLVICGYWTAWFLKRLGLSKPAIVYSSEHVLSVGKKLL